MEHIYDLIIIGSGPAGLSAAVYAQRAMLDTLTIEKNYMSGGQILNTYEVDNYPGLPGIGGFDLGMKLREHAETLGAAFREAEVTGLADKGEYKEIVTEGEVLKARTVIVASGARHRLLGVPGEQELSGMGVSYCATCDGAFFKNKVTAVVGGGDVAVEDAIFLARICKKVYLIHRRNELRAARSLQEKLLALDNVEVVWDHVVDAIQGEAKVESVLLHNVKSEEEKTVKLDGVFVAVGIEPNSEVFKNNLEKDEQGYIRADENGETSIPGVFAAGDVRTKMLRQIITAASDGAVCVTSVQNYLNNYK